MAGRMIAEAFVGQELLAYANPRQLQQLFYWQRQERGSQAEIYPSHLKIRNNNLKHHHNLLGEVYSELWHSAAREARVLTSAPVVLRRRCIFFEKSIILSRD